MPTDEQLADAPSRELNNGDSRVRSLHKKLIVQHINPDIDAFASIENSICTKFLSLDNHVKSLAGDAFSHKYSNSETVYAYPPNGCLHRFISYMDGFKNAPLCVLSHQYASYRMNQHIMNRRFDYYLIIGDRQKPATLCPSTKRGEEGTYFRPNHGPLVTYLHFRNIDYVYIYALFRDLYHIDELSKEDRLELLRNKLMSSSGHRVCLLD